MPSIFRAPAPSRAETAGASANRVVHTAPARTVRTSGAYDRIVTVLAVVAGLGLCAAGWYVSARFTVAALENTAWFTAAGAWLWAIPILVSALELRFGPDRRRGLASRLIWSVVLGLDVLTTAWGALPWVAQWAPDFLTSAALATVLGLVFALAPEPAARAIIRESV